jgi:hypothetical protein
LTHCYLAINSKPLTAGEKQRKNFREGSKYSDEKTGRGLCPVRREKSLLAITFKELAFEDLNTRRKKPGIPQV